MTMFKQLRTKALALMAVLVTGGGSLSVNAQTTTATFKYGADTASGEIEISDVDTSNDDVEKVSGDLTITFSSATNGARINESSGYRLQFRDGSYFTLSGNVSVTKVVITNKKNNFYFNESVTGFTYGGSTTNGDYRDYTYNSDDTESGVDASGDGITFTSSGGSSYVTSITVTYIVNPTNYVDLGEYSSTVATGSSFTMPSGTLYLDDEEADLDDYVLRYWIVASDDSYVTTDETTGTTLDSSTGLVTAKTSTTATSETVSIVVAAYAANDDDLSTVVAKSKTYTLTVVDPTSTTVQTYTNTYTWDFSASNTTSWEASADNLSLFSELGIVTASESTSAWTFGDILSTTDATGYNVEIIKGLRFSGEGTVTLDYSSGYLTVSSGVTLTVPEVTGGWKVMINYSDGTTQILKNNSEGAADVTKTFEETVSITSITVKDGTLTWNYQTISEVALNADQSNTDEARNERYFAYLLEGGDVTPGEADTRVPGITFTMGATETTSTWSAAAGTKQTHTLNSKEYSLSYAVSSTEAIEVGDDNIPTAGTFYKFTVAVNGVLTLYADCYNTNGDTSSPTGVYAKKDGTATDDYDATSLDELTKGFVVLQDSTYYIYCTGENEVLRLYGFDFEPSFIRGGKAIPNNTTLEALTAGDADYEFPVFGEPSEEDDDCYVAYSLYPVSDTDGVSINDYGDLTLEKTSDFDDGPYIVYAKFNLSTTTFGTVDNTLSYIIPSIKDNENLYVLDGDNSAPAVGDKITAISGITMTYGGWTMNNCYYKDTSTSTSEINDYWDSPESDDASRYGTFGGLSLVTSGGRNGRSETRGNDSDTFGSSTGGFEVGNKNSLPVRGAYATFEPTKNGTLGIYILQNGCLNIWGDKSSGGAENWVKTSSTDFNGIVSWRPFYIVDEAGNIVKNVTGKAKARLKWTKEDLDELAEAQENEVEVDYQVTTEARKEYIQGLLNTANKGTAFVHQVDGSKAGDSDGGWLALMKSYVYYKVPVISGKTYYIFSNSSKLGMCGFSFDPYEDDTTDENAPEVKTEALEIANTNSSEMTLPEKGYCYPSATIDREFKANTWSTICLPFSTSKSQLAAAINENNTGDEITVQLLEYWGVRNNKIELVNHVNNENIVAGVPYLVKFSADVSNITISTPVYVPENIAAGSVGTDHLSDASSYDKDYTWKGVFSNKKIDGNDWFLSGGNFVHTGAESDIDSYSYRCFLQCKNTEEAAAKQLLGMYYESAASDDQSVTDGIVAISFDEVDSSVISNVSAGVYNLSGQKVADTIDAVNALPAGIYISGGKKMVIK